MPSLGLVTSTAEYSSLIPPAEAESTVITAPDDFWVPTEVAASIVPTTKFMPAPMLINLLSSTLRTSLTVIAPAALMVMLPSLASTRSTIRSVASLMRTSPETVESTVTVRTSVLSCTLLVAVTSSRSAMNTDAPSAVMDVARICSKPAPATAARFWLAATIPLLSVSAWPAPLTLMLTLRAESKPLRPPTKPVKLRFELTSR